MQHEGNVTGILSRGTNGIRGQYTLLPFLFRRKTLPICTVTKVVRSQSPSGRDGLCGESNLRPTPPSQSP
jgi:hypothetical protein